MNKKVLIPIIIIVLLIPAYFLVNSLSSSDQENTQVAENIPLDDGTTAMMEGTSLGDELGVFESSNAPVAAYKYILDKSSNASYIVQKRFFEKEDVEVVGTTSDVVGAAWFDKDSQELYLKAEVGLTSLASDSAKRDEDIQPLFSDKVATVVLNTQGISNSITEGETFNIPVTVQLTINGVTNDVEFQVEGNLTQEAFSASGEGTVNMSDFGIETPNLLNVFSVDDETVLRFEVEGYAFQTSDTMMKNDDAMMENESMEEEKMENDAMMMEDESNETEAQ